MTPEQIENSPRKVVYELCQAAGQKPPLYIDKYKDGYRIKYETFNADRIQEIIQDFEDAAAALDIPIKTSVTKDGWLRWNAIISIPTTEEGTQKIQSEIENRIKPRDARIASVLSEFESYIKDQFDVEHVNTFPTRKIYHVKDSNNDSWRIDVDFTDSGKYRSTLVYYKNRDRKDDMYPGLLSYAKDPQKAIEEAQKSALEAFYHHHDM